MKWTDELRQWFTFIAIRILVERTIVTIRNKIRFRQVFSSFQLSRCDKNGIKLRNSISTPKLLHPNYIKGQRKYLFPWTKLLDIKICTSAVRMKTMTNDSFLPSHLPNWWRHWHHKVFKKEKWCFVRVRNRNWKTFVLPSLRHTNNHLSELLAMVV